MKGKWKKEFLDDIIVTKSEKENMKVQELQKISPLKKRTNLIFLPLITSSPVGYKQTYMAAICWAELLLSQLSVVLKCEVVLSLHLQTLIHIFALICWQDWNKKYLSLQKWKKSMSTLWAFGTWWVQELDHLRSVSPLLWMALLVKETTLYM